MLVYGNKLGLPTIVSSFLHMHNRVNKKKREKRKALPIFIVLQIIITSN